MKSKYPIHKDFKKIEKITPPLNKPLLKMANFCLHSFPFIHSDKFIDVNVSTFKSSDNKKIKMMIISPKNSDDNMPCLIYYHGGGFMFEIAPYHYKLLKEYAIGANCKVVIIYYRLSVNHPFPTPFNDCFEGYEYVINNYKQLGINKNKIAIGGDSAGGCLAASVCLKIRDLNLVKPVLQLLIYPVLDITMETESMKKYIDTPVWNGTLNKTMWEWYVPNKNIENHSYYSPSLESDFTNLPVSFFDITEFDCLRDEGLNYAKKLKEAGIEVTIVDTNKTIHGYDMVLKSEIVRNNISLRCEALKKAFQ